MAAVSVSSGTPRPMPHLLCTRPWLWPARRAALLCLLCCSFPALRCVRVFIVYAYGPPTQTARRCVGDHPRVCCFRAR